MTTTMITQDLENIQNKYNDLQRECDGLREQLRAADEDNQSFMDDLTTQETIIAGLKHQLDML
jgi:chromosome segregation ATPase